MASVPVHSRSPTSILKIPKVDKQELKYFQKETTVNLEVLHLNLRISGTTSMDIVNTHLLYISWLYIFRPDAPVHFLGFEPNTFSTKKIRWLFDARKCQWRVEQFKLHIALKISRAPKGHVIFQPLIIGFSGRGELLVSGRVCFVSTIHSGTRPIFKEI